MTGLNHSLEKIGEVEVKGCRLHYRYYEPHDEDKAKRTPLVVLHGGPGASHELWYQSLQELSNEQPTLYYDQRGSHFSPAKITAETMTLSQFADDLEAVVSSLGLNKIALLGHSFGGAVALAYMEAHGKKVRSLILSSPLISAAWWKSDGMRLLSDAGYDAAAVLRCEEEGRTSSEYYKCAVNSFEKAHARRTSNGDALCKEMGVKFNGKVYGYLWGDYEFVSTAALKNLDLSEALSMIKTPTLFVCGEHDSARPETMRKAARMMQDASVVEIPDAGHLTFLDNREAYLKAVRNHLSTLDV